jgi:hypothetical protein
MRNVDRGSKTREWARLAFKLGVLLTEPKVRSAVANQMKDRVDSVTDAIADKYENAIDRLGAAGDALQGKSHWPSNAVAMLLGVGVGAGIGILLAPASGGETRQAIRDRAMDMKSRATESASSAAGHIRSTIARVPSTGTEG